MPKITYLTSDGAAHPVDVAAGKSLMDGAVSLQLEGILAECGGCCTCGTCRIDLDPAWSGRVASPLPEELEMLEFAEGAGPLSRLSCQLRVTDDMDGLVVHVPDQQLAI